MKKKEEEKGTILSEFPRLHPFKGITLVAIFSVCQKKEIQVWVRSGRNERKKKERTEKKTKI